MHQFHENAARTRQPAKDNVATKRFLITVFKYGLGVVLLAYVIWRNWNAPPGSESPGLADALSRPIQILPLLLAGVICLSGVLLTFLRWYVLVRAQQLPF